MLMGKLLQKDLDVFMEFQNGVKTCKDKKKPGPSGISQNHAFSLPSEWGGQDYILTIYDLSVVKEMKEQLDGCDLISFSTPEFAVHVQATYDYLDIIELIKEIYGVN